MKVSVTTLPVTELDVDLLIWPLDTRAAEEVAGLAGGQEPALTRAAADFDGKAGHALLLYPEALRSRRLLLLGLGDPADLAAERLREVAAEGRKQLTHLDAETVGMVVPETSLDPEQVCQALVEGFLLAGYRFRRYKTGEDEAPSGPQRLVLQIPGRDKAGRRGAERGRLVAEAVMTARDLVNLSPNEKTPTLLARAIERSARKYGYDVSVWDKALIEEEGMGGLLAVNRGSVEPPTFSVLTWAPEQAQNTRPIVLVGKGVVFDTGGLSLKPTENSMEFMKSDMAGAAVVIATMEALARLEVPLYVVGLIPATDNRPGVNAYVPGDVIRMHNGKTVEVLNTDAEGRMILADALSYANTYNPELVIDLATLTGAAVVALGNVAAAMMTNDTEGADRRIDAMRAAGERSGDRVHPMPMYADYDRLLESAVADLKNIGGRGAGAITAAKFLEHFVNYPWIHLDIAGPSFLKEDRGYRARGGTGFGVRLLVEFLRTYAATNGR